MSIVVGKANTTESIWTCDLCGRQDRRFDGEPHYGWGEDDCRTPHQLCPDCLIEMTKGAA